jgi:hypothetical protein
LDYVDFQIFSLEYNFAHSGKTAGRKERLFFPHERNSVQRNQANSRIYPWLFIKLWSPLELWVSLHKGYFFTVHPYYGIYCIMVNFFIHLFTCAYIVWVISLPWPLPPPSPPHTPSLPGRTCSALISNFVEENIEA